jgi:hypothetical protein
MSSAGSSRASERRNSLIDSVLHRLSVDLGVIGELGPDGVPPPPGPSQVLDEEQAIAATQSTVVGGIETVDNPVSILYQVYRTNVEGLVSATPALALILGSKLLVDWLAAKGGPWGDTMGARCACCMAGKLSAGASKSECVSVSVSVSVSVRDSVCWVSFPNIYPKPFYPLLNLQGSS